MKMSLDLKCRQCDKRLRLESDTVYLLAGAAARGEELQRLAAEHGWSWPANTSPLCPEHAP